MIAVLAGGVGAARMLKGLTSVVDQGEVTAIVNTGDDVVMHGLHISPDIDTVVYTLAGVANEKTGWGLQGETWQAMGELRELSAGVMGWFSLGDHDLGTHLYRTSRLREGATLSEVTAELAARWGLGLTLLPMSDDRVETRVTLRHDGREIGFQEYFVGRRHQVDVSQVRFVGIDRAAPAAGALEAVTASDGLLICPSNPIVSIGPILAVPTLGDAVEAARDRAVAVSPIVAGRALKGPADRLLVELGFQSSVVGVAQLWAPYASTLVIDEADVELAGGVEKTGMRCVVTKTVMRDRAAAAALGEVVMASFSG